MKKAIGGVIGIIIVAAVVAGVMFWLGQNKKDTNKPSEQSSSQKNTTYTPRKACDILTADIAHQIAGANASTSETPSPETSTSSVSVTNCDYYSSSTKQSVSLLSRSVLDQAGADTNKSQFDNPPADAQDVARYGDSAYWSPSYGQLNILKNHNWYILQAGGIKPTDRTLDQAKKFADLIIDKL